MVTANLAPAPTYVVTLVHGTWAANSDWTQENSRLSRKLCEELDGYVLIKRFLWTGKNSYRARHEAGEELRRFLTGLMQDYPVSRHIVMGHSHGGNVTLYALNDALVGGRITGVVCLATPFLICTPKNVAFHIAILFNGALYGIGFAVLQYFGLPLVYRGLEYSRTFDGLAAVAVYVGVLWLALKVGSGVAAAVKNLASESIGAFSYVADKRQAELMSRLTTPGAADVPLLALRFRGDEARFYLAFLAMISMPFSIIFRLVGYGFFAVFTLSVLMMVLDFVADLATVLGIWVSTRPWVLTERVYLLSFFVLVVTLVGVLTMPKLLRGHRLGFGEENYITPLLVRIAPGDLPAGFTNAKIVRYSLKTALREMTAGRGLFNILNLRLLHSWLYQSEPAIRDIREWVGRLPNRGVGERA